MAEPARARAVLSTEDLTLIREAVLHYLKVIEDKPESVKFAQLYHRLGSAGGKWPLDKLPHIPQNEPSAVMPAVFLCSLLVKN